MTHDSYLLDNKTKKKGSWIGRLMKLVFFVAAFILIILTILGNMGGSSDALKENVATFISGSFGGRHTEINKLVHMGFFPTVGVDAKGISVMSRPEGGVPVVTIGQIQAFMSFWDVATRDAKFSKLYIEDFRAIRGIFGAQEIIMDKLFIDHDLESQEAKLRGDGKIGIHAWDLDIDLKVFNKKGKYKYMVDDAFQANMNIADISFSANFLKHEDGYFKVDNFTLTSSEKEITGGMTLSTLGANLLKIKGQIQVDGAEDGLNLDLVADFSQRPVQYSGVVSSDKMTLSDWVGPKSFSSVVTRLRYLLGHDVLNQLPSTPRSVIGNYGADIMFDLKNVTLNENQSANLKFPLVQEADRLKVGPVMTGDDISVPPVLVFFEAQNGNLVSILQSGRLDASLLRPFFKALPQKLKTKDVFTVECGLSVFAPKGDERVEVKSLGVNLADGALSTNDESYEATSNAASLNYIYKEQKMDLENVSVNEGTYKFVQASLEKTAQESACGRYITQQKPEDVAQDAGQDKAPEDALAVPVEAGQ